MESISTFARRVGLTPRALRFYEEKGLLCPSRDPENGYRLYGPAELQRVRQICFWRELGLELEAIAALPLETGALPRHLQQVLRERLAVAEVEAVGLYQQVQALRDLLTKLKRAEFLSDVSEEELFAQLSNLNDGERNLLMTTLTQAYAFSATVRRPRNEDRSCIDKNAQREIYAVADGMAQHIQGERAPQLALEWLCAHLDSTQLTPLRYEEHLRTLFAEINQRVYTELNQAGALPRAERGGCTLTCLILRQQRAYLAHVGDSRIYRYAQGQLQQLSQDHTPLQQMLERGDILRKDLAQHPLRNQVYAMVGLEAELGALQVAELNVVPGEIYLLCSDGITQILADTELAALLAAHPLEKALQEMQALAERHGEDNATAISVAIA